MVRTLKIICNVLMVLTAILAVITLIIGFLGISYYVIPAISTMSTSHKIMTLTFYVVATHINFIFWSILSYTFFDLSRNW